MNKAYIAVIDAGSSKVKAAVYDSEGRHVASSDLRSPREAENPGLSDAEQYYNTVLSCLKNTVDAIGQSRDLVEVIAMTGQMAGAVGVDENWQAVTSWSGTMHTDHIPYFKQMPEAYHQNLLPVCGTNAPFMLPKIKWMQHTFSKCKDARKFLIMGNYVAGRMANIDIEDAFIDRTLLEWTGCGDLAHDRWSPLLCELAELDVNLLPRIVPSSTVVGHLWKEAAQRCGLRSGIPIVAGAGDKPAGCIGAGVVRPGQLIDESSTVGALSQCIDRFVPDTKHRMLETIPSPIPGEYYSSIYFTGSGASLEWFLTNVCHQSAEEGCYEEMSRLAGALPPGSEGLLAIGMLSGRALPLDPDVRGLWMGHSWQRGAPHFFRSLLESYGYEYACAYGVMRDNYPHLEAKQVLAIGGGANSPLYNSIKADIMGLPYALPGRDDVTTLGAAIIGGFTVGIFDDIKQTAERFARIKTRFEPDMGNHAAYQPYARLYASAYDTLRPIYEELARLRER